MPRKARITVAGAVHHIMSRSIEGRNIFCDDSDRLVFMNTFGQQLMRSGYLLYAWCLIPNHYHLVVRINNFPVGYFMRLFNGHYALYFRKKIGGHGHLFQDRYKSIVTQDQFYIEESIRYVHLNPLRAGLCKDLDQLDALSLVRSQRTYGKAFLCCTEYDRCSEPFQY
ncbi:MAG: transposase [Chitinivibrionales bacterium]|nr:transposase [Chitinivibrionales bacterium]